MESLAFAIGTLLVILGPLLIIPATWLLSRLAIRPVISRILVPTISIQAARRTALGLSLVIVLGALSLSYFPGKFEYDRQCAEHATPVVQDQVRVEGFYHSRLYPHQARRYLDEDSFAFVEAPHMYEKDSFIRYSKTIDNRIREQKLTTLKSLYGVRQDLHELSFGIVMTSKTVYEIASNRQLATASHIVYHGGPLSLLLGVYGMSSCPDISLPEGSQHFDTFYNLEAKILRASPEAEQ